jgi:glycosyltransferase involved in cell wall biosynthesis
VTESDVAFFSKWSRNVSQCLDVFASEVDFHQRVYTPGSPLRLVAIGRLDRLKGLDLAIEALIDVPGVYLDIYGTGSEYDLLRDKALQLGLFNVRLVGSIPRSELLCRLRDYHVLIHPSLKEAGGSGVIEALESGLPVIAHSAFGMAFSVDNDNGWPIPYASPEVTITEIRRVVREIIARPEVVAYKSRCAYVSARRFLPKMLVDEVRCFMRS